MWRSCVLPLILLPVLAVRGASAAQANQPSAHYVVILVLDGARPDLFRLSSMPNYRRLLGQGVLYTRAFVGQQIANTPPSHATIGTGVFPKHHGVQGFVFVNPDTGLAYRPADLPAVQAGALEQIMTRNHVPSLAAAIKQSDSSARIIAVSGHKCYAADAMGTPAADYILCAFIYHDRWVAQAIGHHIPPPGAINNPRWDVPIPSPRSGFAPAVEQWNLTTENHWTVSYALWAFRRVHYPRALMINLPETDVIGHFVGSNPQPLRTLMRGFDRDLGRIIAAYRDAGILRRTTFVITADHGMSPITARLPFGDLDRAIELAGATKLYLEADTGAVIGIKELDKARAVAQNVARLDRPMIDASFYKVLDHGGWSYRTAYMRPGSPLELQRAFLALADTAASTTGPDVIVDYEPHVTTGDRPANGYHWLAGHLGPQWDEQHIPLLIAGAGIRHGVTSSYPARLVDIVPTLERILGVRLTPSDGVVLADALSAPRSNDTIIARRERAVLSPVVEAIAHRSGAR